ncbi:MAG TPA: zf-HC2 domain-containing protein [Candidatus Eisenbacteria bacterium]
MTDRWTDRLSEYLDGSLPPPERRELEAHLAGCPTCGAVLDDLRDVVDRARGLHELDASIGVGGDLWPGIEARIRELPSAGATFGAGAARGGWAAHRFTLSMPQLAAASFALIAFSAALFWFTSDFAGRKEAARLAAGTKRVAVVAASSAPVEAALAEIVQLKKLLDQRREELDPETLRALEESLGAVEAAVGEASRALEADPGNPYIQGHLESMRERQLHLLRRAVALAGGAE